MPVFLIGTQRSGSNLLQLMLDQSKAIIAPHPPHILERLGPLVPFYGDLNSASTFSALIDDVCQLIETNPVAWEIGHLDQQAISERCGEKSLVAIFGAVHDILAAHNDAHDWMCKSLANVHYTYEIESYFGDKARYIHLHRDPRDVALSFQKAIVGEKTWYHIAKQWDDEQRKALNLKARLGGDRFLSVSYSDLVSNPHETLNFICDFIKIKFEPCMLEFHTSSQAQNTSKAGEMWNNVSNPIMVNNFNKFLSSSPIYEVAVMEHVATETMEALNYPKACASWTVGHLNLEQISEFERQNSTLKDATVANAKIEDLERRNPQAKTIAKIKARLNTVHSAV